MPQLIYIFVAHTIYCKTHGHELYKKKPDNDMHYAHSRDVVNISVHLKVSKHQTGIL
jgi:hypothetical protein